MECINELRNSLNVHLGWNKARITCFVNMLLALLTTRTVNLNKLACVVSGEAQLSVTTNSRGMGVDIDALFYGLKPGEQRILKGQRIIWGQLVCLSGLRLTDGE